MTRKQLYDEIWEISFAGVAKKYNLPYTHLMKQIKDSGIPIPPSGYWTKLNFNKPVTKPALPEPADEIVLISRTLPSARKKKLQSFTNNNSGRAEIEARIAEASPTLETYALTVEEQAKYEQSGQAYNIYDRELLYNEIWLAPVTEIAKRYAVSDVAIRKVCQSLDIPMPPVGYWAKLRAGKAVTRTPLLITNKPTKKTGVSPGTDSTPPLEKETLSFLNAEDRSVVLSIATQIRLPDENAKMHPTQPTEKQSSNGRKNKKSKKQEVTIGEAWILLSFLPTRFLKKPCPGCCISLMR